MSRVKLDAADLRILEAVQRHGRLSKTALAEKVNLSPTPCWTRLKRLERAGIVRGYAADIDLTKVAGTQTVMVTVALDHHTQADFERFERHIREIDAIVECLATGGGFDYVLKVVTRDLATFQDLMDELLAAGIGIERYVIHIVTRSVKASRPALPPA